MMLIFDDLGCCKRCGSTETRTEMLIPTLNARDLRGKERNQIVEIFCKKCGKINRTTVKMKIK